MSGSSRRRHSKWDDKDSEALSETILDRAPARKPREPLSPSRGSRRHESRSREGMTSWDREGNGSRMSPGLEEWSHRHNSRSPRNGWGRSYRSRSRSRSRSPTYNSRREPSVNEKNRSKSGVSSQICRDFSAGRCRRGSHCHFLHQDAQVPDSGRHSESGPVDDWESSHRRTGGSRYSPDNTKGHALLSEKSVHICNDFVMGKCRRGSSCRYSHHDGVADAFERAPIDDVYRDRDRDNEHRNRDTYPDRNPERDRDNERRSRDTFPDRNHDRDPPRRGEALCKFFAAGNCRNGKHCRFSHQEVSSPQRRPLDDRRPQDDRLLQDDRRSQDDRREPPDHIKLDRSHIWEGPTWSEAARVSDVPAVEGWRDDRNDVKEVAKQTWDAPPGIADTRTRDDRQGPPDHKLDRSSIWEGPKWSDATRMTNVPEGQGWGDNKNDMAEVGKQSWNLPGKIDESKTRDERQPLQWKAAVGLPETGLSESRSTENFPSEMEISPRDIVKQQGLSSLNSQNPSLPNISFPAVQQDTAGKAASYQNHHAAGFQEQKAFNDPYSGPNPNIMEEGRYAAGNSDGSFPNPPMNVQHFNVQPISSINLPAVGDRMQTSIQNPVLTAPLQPGIFKSDPRVNVQPVSSINVSSEQALTYALCPSDGDGMQKSHNSSFLGSEVANISHLPSANASALASACTTNQSTVSSEQLAKISHISASLAQLLENRQQLPHLSSAVAPNGTSNLPDQVSGATFQPNQVPILKLYDPIGDNVDPRVPTSGDNQTLPNVAEQKSVDNKPVSKDGENDGKIADGRSKAPESAQPEETAGDDELDDGKKSKDAKAIRPFKFALADFVKELLKPTWKDGQINKEAYKTIVKKVVDKVVESQAQGFQIPQTKERIDHYLSSSKPKLEKFVQAYVGKYQNQKA